MFEELTELVDGLRVAEDCRASHTRMVDTHANGARVVVHDDTDVPREWGERDAADVRIVEDFDP